jgi:starvation-inducible DNA-binding protein
MAERVQVLGGVALGTVETVAGSSTVKPYPTDLVKETDHVQAVCARISDLGARMRDAITQVTEAGDDGTADIFVGVSRQLDKDLWFLESHLAK